MRHDENVTSIAEIQKPYCECFSHDPAENAYIIISPDFHTEMKAFVEAFIRVAKIQIPYSVKYCEDYTVNVLLTTKRKINCERIVAVYWL
jgi:hypothetical protein